MTESIERLLGSGIFFLVRVDAGIDGGFQTVPYVNVGKSVEREVGDAPFVGVHCGFGDTVHLCEVGTHIVGTHDLSVTEVAHNTVLVAKDITLSVSQIYGIDGTHHKNLAIDIVITRVLGVARVGTVVGGGAGKADITAHVEPFGGLICGLQA